MAPTETFSTLTTSLFSCKRKIETHLEALVNFIRIMLKIDKLAYETQPIRSLAYPAQWHRDSSLKGWRFVKKSNK
jgi:hypothetical protein